MPDTEKPEYEAMIATARNAFSSDSAYAMTMAQQAHIVRARRDGSRSRKVLSNTAETASSSD